ncbi:hypothetical protein LM599_05290 [Candidatus Acetothermia bacterium]|nr:hypothetical protein [Candidatus Acetothermia bacterium]
MPTQSDRKSLYVTAIVVVLTLFISFSGFAGGVSIKLLFYTLDLAASLAKVPDAITDSLTALGVSPADATMIRTDVENMTARIKRDFSTSSVPIPLLGGAIEFPLPLIVIDGLRLSGGILTDTILRNVGSIFNLTIPQPLLEKSFDIEGQRGSITIDPRFSTMMGAVEVVNRIDLLIAGIELGAGVGFIQGSITPQVKIDVPKIFAVRIPDALAALHRGELVWSAFVTHLSLGVEIGPPFFRLFARGHLIIPLRTTTGWWEIKIGRFAGSLGVVVRF